MIEVKNIEKPDERRDFPLGHLEVLQMTGLVFGVGTMEPGWRWSESVKPIAGTEYCETGHQGYVLEGRLRVRMRDGDEQEVGPGDVFVIPPGHDAWVVGDTAFRAFDFAGQMDEYAKERG
ncbi:cupin domain-containing protein [Thermomonospora umbrina]|uniref:Cupin domain n=1 Tax=Thermomonospora umbrina TaxID=111806 RepID=A0A3D9SV47_9ACTN|nr:cupin domain-containing protein [Thermomonospora umbrina]REE99839.1 cupin domain [Thermomonospora umbrina]